MDEEHAEYNILLTVQRHTFDDFYRTSLLYHVENLRSVFNVKEAILTQRRQFHPNTL